MNYHRLELLLIIACICLVLLPSCGSLTRRVAKGYAAGQSYTKALSLINEEKYREAIPYLDKAINMRHDPSVYALRGFAYVQLEQYERAIADLDTAIEQYPKDEISHKTAQVMQHIGIYPTQAFACSYRGLAYTKIHQLEAAVIDCNRALQMDPKRPEFYVNRAELLDALGEPQKAIDDCTRSIAIYPHFAGVFSDRAHYYCKVGQYEKALADCNTSIKLRANVGNTYRNRARAWVGLGQFQKAIEDCNTAISLNPRSPLSYEIRAQAEEKSGKKDLAAKSVAQSRELARQNSTEKQSWESLMNAAALALAQNRLKDCEGSLLVSVDEAKKFGDDNKRVWISLSELERSYALAGKPRQAETARKQREKLHARLGKPDSVGMDKYQIALHKSVQRTWRHQYDIPRSAVVSFCLDRSGNVSLLRMAKSSGDILHDLSCLNAVKTAAPFGTLPADSPSAEVDMEYGFGVRID